MTQEEWYRVRQYVGYDRTSASRHYDWARPPTEFYPGHLAYSGLTLNPLDTRNEPKEPDTPSWSAVAPEAKERDFVDDLLASKVEGMRQNIDRIQYQIERREKLREQNLYGIDLDMCKLKTELFECELWPKGANKTIEQRRSQLERQLDDMERDKRAEDVMGWRDRQMLLREMREAGLEYESATRRKGLLEQDASTGSPHYGAGNG